MSEFDNLISDGPAVEYAPPPHEPVHPLVPIEMLERPSPQPFSGRPDPDYPELDSGEPLYVPRFLLRRWGADTFRRSAYYQRWESAAGRRQHADAKPERKK